jgi:hypothetical protein
MRTGLLLVAFAGMFATAEEKPEPVRELTQLNSYPSDKTEAVFGGAKRIETSEELADHVSEKVWRGRFEQNVDFTKESLILFEWYGSKFDQLTASEAKDDTGTLVKFTYTKRKIVMRSDGKGFVRVFVLPKKTRLVVDNAD